MQPPQIPLRRPEPGATGQLGRLAVPAHQLPRLLDLQEPNKVLLQELPQLRQAMQMS
jgi:hypothetical protein